MSPVENLSVPLLAHISGNAGQAGRSAPVRFSEILVSSDAANAQLPLGGRLPDRETAKKLLDALTGTLKGIARQARHIHDGIFRDRAALSSEGDLITGSIPELEASLAGVISKLKEVLGPDKLIEIGDAVKEQVTNTDRGHDAPRGQVEAGNVLWALGSLEDIANALAVVIRKHGAADATASSMHGNQDGPSLPGGATAAHPRGAGGENPAATQGRTAGEKRLPSIRVLRSARLPEPAPFVASDGGKVMVAAAGGKGSQPSSIPSSAARPAGDETAQAGGILERAFVHATGNAAESNGFQGTARGPAQRAQLVGTSLPATRVDAQSGPADADVPTTKHRPDSQHIPTPKIGEQGTGHGVLSRSSLRPVGVGCVAEGSASRGDLQSAMSVATQSVTDADGLTITRAIRRGSEITGRRLANEVVALTDEQTGAAPDSLAEKLGNGLPNGRVRLAADLVLSNSSSERKEDGKGGTASGEAIRRLALRGEGQQPLNRLTLGDLGRVQPGSAGHGVAGVNTGSALHGPGDPNSRPSSRNQLAVWLVEKLILREVNPRQALETRPSPLSYGEIASLASAGASAMGRGEASPRKPVSGESRFAQFVLAQVRNAEVRNGSTRVELKPRALGQVEIQVKTDADGTLRIIVRADNPVVLNAMRDPRHGLEQMMGTQGATFEFQDGDRGESSGGHRSKTVLRPAGDPEGDPRGVVADTETMPGHVANNQLDITT